MPESLDAVGLLAGGGGDHSFGDATWLILIIWAAAIPLLIAAARHVALQRPFTTATVSIEPLELQVRQDGSQPRTECLELPARASAATSRVRLVIISDTHSFEQDLTKSNALPDGDVLIHGGDFAANPRYDGTTVEAALAKFDAWLASQPHTHKIVIAGNHDPATAHFPLSGAVYAGRAPRSIEVAGVTIGLVPYFREHIRKTRWISGKPRVHVEKVKHKHFALPRGEVLVTHSPPHGIVDRCGSGEHGGSPYLRALMSRAAVKPALWICGHIHEARGAAVVHFGRGGHERTVVLNAANANSGIARRLVHGAVVVDLTASLRP